MPRRGRGTIPTREFVNIGRPPRQIRPHVTMYAFGMSDEEIPQVHVGYRLPTGSRYFNITIFAVGHLKAFTVKAPNTYFRQYGLPKLPEGMRSCTPEDFRAMLDELRIHDEFLRLCMIDM